MKLPNQKFVIDKAFYINELEEKNIVFIFKLFSLKNFLLGQKKLYQQIKKNFRPFISFKKDKKFHQFLDRFLSSFVFPIFSWIRTNSIKYCYNFYYLLFFYSSYQNFREMNYKIYFSEEKFRTTKSYFSNFFSIDIFDMFSSSNLS